MIRMIAAALLASSLMLGGFGCQGGGAKTADAGAQGHACKMCEKGQAGASVWCDKCSKGYVKGKAVKCASCYAAKTGGPECTKCAKKKG